MGGFVTWYRLYVHARTLLSSKPPTQTGPDIDVFDRVKAPSQRGTEGSNLASSSAESATNLVAAGRVARGWDSQFESALLQRRVSCELPCEAFSTVTVKPGSARRTSRQPDGDLLHHQTRETASAATRSPHALVALAQRSLRFHV